ncbi:MAG: DUF4389 domain-containing protein [Solirubrobacterales bacterium]|nr:DUF4389 domain-containing protein [Solirubrobacterales bacterium]
MNDVPSPPPPPSEGQPSEPAPVVEPDRAATGYPVSVFADMQDEYVRFLPLVKWLLLIPHYVVLFFLGIAAMVVAFIAFFATLFTGRYPRGMWDFMRNVQRWVLRVYAYLFLITDQYPPFSLEEEAGDPVRLEAAYPEHVSRWRPLFAWLIVIPYAIVAALIGVLGQVCALFALFTIIFTKKIPEDLFKIIRVSFNWQMRASFYSYWMSTEYPPFVWDDQD